MYEIIFMFVLVGDRGRRVGRTDYLLMTTDLPTPERQ